MAIRTTDEQVAGILAAGRDYNGESDLSFYIETATVLVDRVVECAARKGITHSDAQLELIERWLSAHFYAVSDKPLQFTRTATAGGSFQGKTGMMLEFTGYGQMAVLLDTSGCLAALGKQRRAGIDWLGRPPSEQTDYVDRS